MSDNSTNFHDAFRVKNDTRLGESKAETKRKRHGAESPSKNHDESWSGFGASFTGKVKRDKDTGRAIEVSPRTYNGEKISGKNASDMKRLAIAAFEIQERERIERENRREKIGRFNELQRMADRLANGTAEKVRGSIDRDNERMNRIRGNRLVEQEPTKENPARPNLVGTGSVSVHKSPGTGRTEIHGKVIPVDPEEFIDVPYAFQYSINSDLTVAISSGSFEQHGPDGTDYYTTSSTGETIGDTGKPYTVIYAKLDFLTTVASIGTAHASTETGALEQVVSTDTTMLVPLFCFYYDATNVAVNLIRLYHSGNISILPKQAP